MKNEKDYAFFLIEDDDIDAEGIKRAFNSHKIVNPIIRAKDGVEALEMLDQGKLDTTPFVILLDLNMPRMGGIPFLKKLRQHNVYQDAIVVVLTTSGSDQDIFDAYEEKISGYFVKNNLSGNFFNITKLFNGHWKMVQQQTT